MATSPPATAIASLDRLLRGPLIGRADARFDDARRIWNGRIDRRPMLIAQCADVADIIVCVHFAHDHALPVAVRGSGHACAGTALCDDGLVVDLSRMKGICVVPDRGIVRAEPGVTWGGHGPRDAGIRFCRSGRHRFRSRHRRPLAGRRQWLADGHVRRDVRQYPVDRRGHG